MKLTGENRNTRGKSCPSANFSTTNPTRTDRESNPGLRGDRPATNRLSHGTTLQTLLAQKFVCFVDNLDEADERQSNKISSRLRVYNTGHLINSSS